MDDDLIAAHREVPLLMPYLHLPVQSGSDRILEAMNRRHGRDLFLSIVDRLRTARPGLALSAPVCVQCAHTFRPGEMVVICPCQPAPAPGAVRCGKAIHRDPAAGLPCWEGWQPSDEVAVCPVRHARVGQPSEMG